MTTTKKKKPNSKAIGNRYETRVAKLLSDWMFDDSVSIIRSITSGALKDEKVSYNGDLIPIGEKVYTVFKQWPFLIECKTGYEKDTATFQNYSILKQWIVKLNKEKTDKQQVLLLIVRFGGSNSKELLISNCKFTIEPDILFKVENSYYYCYSFKELLEYEIESLVSKDFKQLYFK
jgi:hypothetical protein